MEFFQFAVILLLLFAVFDLSVGVSNDAVNFLNSAVGSRVAPRAVIMTIASLGVLVGVLFSSGMMEVARKGIFHPEFFTMPELMTVFLAVMIADVLLLDLFNTYGFPTSTTVSIIFELLGGAVAVSILKVLDSGQELSTVAAYINSAKVMTIILGILLSVIVAFTCGALAQFLSRLIFTFDFSRRLQRYGGLWGGMALAAISYFILIKGVRGTTLVTEVQILWIQNHSWLILGSIFVASAVVLQVFLLSGFNILRSIVLIGTFALAMAFAANDLVNFVGVPLAGLHAYNAATATNMPLTATMDALKGQIVPSETWFLVIAGVVMVVTLWISKKARTVTETEVSLGQQEEGEERFESVFMSRILVRMWLGLFEVFTWIIPASIRNAIKRRIDPGRQSAVGLDEAGVRFDLLRASVNLVVASAIISFATSNKLPLSTTYVTFMVAMGTSFADLAWGRESAVYRVSGVLAVVGGWFVTAMMAFLASFAFAAIIHYSGPYGVVLLLVLAGIFVWRTHRVHKQRRQSVEDLRIVNLRKVGDAAAAVSATFEHMGILIREIHESFLETLDALFIQDLRRLRAQKQRVNSIQRWANIIVANVFKSMRLVQKSDSETSYRFAQTVRRLQEMTDGYRDTVLRAYVHVNDNHKGLLDAQIEDLLRLRALMDDVLTEIENAFSHRDFLLPEPFLEKDKQLRDLADKLNRRQIERIVDDTSKTRLSILFYAIVGNAMLISKQNLELIDIFREAFGRIGGKGTD